MPRSEKPQVKCTRAKDCIDKSRALFGGACACQHTVEHDQVRDCLKPCPAYRDASCQEVSNGF